MNKFSKILYAAMALAMAVCNFSCSDDEELPTGDLELNSGSSVTTETLKVLSYNVLEGMKLDKANDYNNFVTWVSEQAPDIMAIEETNGFTKEKLTALSARWGHPYAEMCKESGYPVSITSKFGWGMARRYSCQDQRYQHSGTSSLPFLVYPLRFKCRQWRRLPFGRDSNVSRQYYPQVS